MDFTARMEELVDEATGRGEWSASRVASELVQELSEHRCPACGHPDGVLGGWLQVTAVAHLSQMILARNRGRRASARQRMTRRKFTAAVRAAEDSGGTVPVAGLWNAEYAVEGGTCRKARDMTGGDHAFVASGYRRTADTFSMEASFHEAVAARLGVRRTYEVYTAEEYERMWRSVAGR